MDVDATIEVLTSRPNRSVFLVDFDGSLSPIVERAEDARPLPAVVELLERLATRLGRVGVVSGRPVGYLAEHVGARGVTLTGLYGMEHVIDGQRRVDPRVEPYLAKMADAQADLLARLPRDLVEEKSGVCVTVHWRPRPELEPEILATAREVAARYGLGLLQTRMAIEVRPPVDIDKGVAVAELIAGFAVAAFAGDDTGDLPAFAALEQAVAKGELDAAIRIGVQSPEAPADLAPAVDLMVDGPAGLVALLTRVADQIA